jgi:hypothetical protein
MKKSVMPGKRVVFVNGQKKIVAAKTKSTGRRESDRVCLGQHRLMLGQALASASSMNHQVDEESDDT